MALGSLEKAYFLNIKLSLRPSLWGCLAFLLKLMPAYERGCGFYFTNFSSNAMPSSESFKHGI